MRKMRHYDLMQRLTRPYSKGVYGLLRRKKQGEKAIAYNRQLDSDGTRWVENASDGLRFTGKAHDIARAEGYRLDHTGWYLDDDGMGETCWGVVYQLPARNGELQYVPGHATSYDDGGACLDFSNIKSELRDAVYASDRLAERYAEVEREYQRVESAKMRIEDITAEIKDAYAACRDLCNEIRASGVDQVAVVRKLIRAEVCRVRRSVRKLYKERAELRAQIA
jgi:hypothetical protein